MAEAAPAAMPNALRPIIAVSLAVVAAPVGAIGFLVICVVLIPYTLVSLIHNLLAPLCASQSMETEKGQKRGVSLTYYIVKRLGVPLYALLLPLPFLVLMVGWVLNILTSPIAGLVMSAYVVGYCYNRDAEEHGIGCFAVQSLNAAVSAERKLIVAFWEAGGYWHAVVETASVICYGELEEEEVLKKGLLYKEMSPAIGHKSFFVLSTSMLSWYKDEAAHARGRPPLGAIRLEGARVRRLTPFTPMGAERLMLRGRGRLAVPMYLANFKMKQGTGGATTGYLAAGVKSDEADLRAWEEAIRAVIEKLKATPTSASARKDSNASTRKGSLLGGTLPTPSRKGTLSALPLPRKASTNPAMV